MSACTTDCRACTGKRFEHCKCSGSVHFPLWSAEALPELDAMLAQCSEYGRRIMPEDLSDPDRAEPVGVECSGSLHVDLSMLGTMLLGGQFGEIASLVVGSHVVPVVDLRAVLRVHDEAVFVRFEDLRIGDPSKPDVPVPTEVAARLYGRWFLAGQKSTDWLGVRPSPDRLAHVAPPALPGGSGDHGLALDADDVHALTLQWKCHRTFGGNTLGDAHRVLVETYVVAKPTLKSRNSEAARHFATEEDVPKGWVTQSVGNIRKRCLTDEELAAKGWRIVNGVVRGPQWADNPWTKKDELAEEIESVLDAEDSRSCDTTLDLLDEPGLVEVPETTKPIPPVGGMDLDALLADWDEAAANL